MLRHCSITKIGIFPVKSLQVSQNGRLLIDIVRSNDLTVRVEKYLSKDTLYSKAGTAFAREV